VNQEEVSQGNKFVFSYRVDITNDGEDWAKLLSRYWLIIDSEGNKEEVRGAGVIGCFPELKPGQSLTYTS
jgi:ApaG protein